MTLSINTIKRINEFSCTMAKLEIWISNSLDESSKQLTNFPKSLKEITLTDSGEYKHQVVSLQNYLASYMHFLMIMKILFLK